MSKEVKKKMPLPDSEDERTPQEILLDVQSNAVANKVERDQQVVEGGSNVDTGPATPDVDEDGEVAPKKKVKKIQVVAKGIGYYNGQRLKAGDKFMIDNEEAFSKLWMKHI